jgi:hypothetical protein
MIVGEDRQAALLIGITVPVIHITQGKRARYASAPKYFAGRVLSRAPGSRRRQIEWSKYSVVAGEDGNEH